MGGSELHVCEAILLGENGMQNDGLSEGDYETLAQKNCVCLMSKEFLWAAVDKDVTNDEQSADRRPNLTKCGE